MTRDPVIFDRALSAIALMGEKLRNKGGENFMQVVTNRNQEGITVLFLLLYLLIPGGVEGQLVVNNNPTAQQLVQNVLVGNGVQISNVQFTGDSIQIGRFDGKNANIPFGEGVVMSTGECPDAVGPNNDGSMSTSLGNTWVDPDLMSVAASTNPNTNDINDVAIIEFDFVPQGDTIDFNFIFGSDEHPEFSPPQDTSSGFNDVFGFFISGPGINGSYQNNAENIALIPGTNSPVTISDVNPSNNPTYYVDNGDGSTSPYDTDSAYIQPDGQTVPLTASKGVFCDSTYHLKLAIGDGNDQGWDSWVFLEGGSLTSNAFKVDQEVNIGQNDSTLWEGCGEFDLDVISEGSDTTGDTIFVKTSGTATEGSDYNNLPDSLIFAPGQDTVTLQVNAFDDGVLEGKEKGTIDIIYPDPSACGNWDTATTDFFIEDPDTVQLNTSADTSIGACTDSISIHASAKGGYGEYQWSWSQGIPNGDSTGMIAPNVTTTYVVSVSDTCAANKPTDSITVSIPAYPPLQVHPYNDTSFVCPDQTVPVGIDSISGGSGNSTFTWDSLGTDSSYMLNPSETTTYRVTAVDTCLNDTAVGTVKVTKGFMPLEIEAGRDTTICAGSQGNLLVRSYSGGTGAIDFEWSPGDHKGANTWYMSDSITGTHSSTTYSVTAEDSCGVTAMDSMKVELSTPSAAFTYKSKTQETGSPIRFISRSKNADRYFWNFGFENYSSRARDTVLSYPEPGTYEVMLAVMDGIGCEDTAKERIRINPPFNLYVPNAFTPDGNGVNDVFRGKGVGIASYHMQIFNRWGKLVYQTQEIEGGWDGTIDGEPAPAGVYIYKFTVRGENGEVKTIKGHVNLLR